MASRLQLHEDLESILGSTRVYFQPGASETLRYPCIVYELDSTFTRKADNRNYLIYNRYHIKHLFKSLDREKKDALLENFKMITHDSRMVVDGLYNDDFTLYY